MTLIQFGVEGSLSGNIQASAQWQECVCSLLLFRCARLSSDAIIVLVQIFRPVRFLWSSPSMHHLLTLFDCSPRGSKLGILTAISTLGNMAGNLTAPYFTDRLGRKGSLLIGACGTVLFVALQSAAQNLNWYLASRFFLGFFLLFCHNASPAFLSEFAPTKERTTVLSCCEFQPLQYRTCAQFGRRKAPIVPYGRLAVAGQTLISPLHAILTVADSPFYFVGAIVISWTCYSTVNWTNDWSWRAPSLVQAVPALIQIAAWPFIPESCARS